MAKAMTPKELIASLREGPFTSTGSYPKFWFSRDSVFSYAAIMAHALEACRAARSNDYSEWRILGCDVNWENPALFCDETGDRIESAYADEPEAR